MIHQALPRFGPVLRQLAARRGHGHPGMAKAMTVAKPEAFTLEASEAAPAASQQTGPSYTTTAPERYEEQLARKHKRVEELFSDFQLPQMEVFESEREHYRLRQAAARELCRLSPAVAQLPCINRETSSPR